ncbi:MAG: metallopeptidase TldD-related protein [Bacillota bacterium]|nr:metallopeptidase TldD-related protein [Bacillota bacterium]
MKQEFITIREKETTARIQASQVQAVRIKDITKKGVRVYQDGKIGIAGIVGDTEDSVLLQEAVTNLEAGIEYPFPLSKDLKDHRSYGGPIAAQEVVNEAEAILAVLRDEFPDFSFSEFVAANEIEYSMRNSEGLDLKYQDAYFNITLILKEKATANLFDGALVCGSRRFEREKFLSFNREFLAAYRNKVELPEGEKLPVFTLGADAPLEFIGRALNGERYAKGGSLFSGRLGEQLFSERITIELNRDPLLKGSPFFDAEGVVLPNDRLAVFEAGKLVNVLTDKKTALLYDLPHTGAATGGYDDVPTIDGAHGRSLAFKTDAQDIAAALKGQPAIFAFMASGGDFTADGSYATPVQVAFLFDGKRIIGKLPEFAMRSHLDKMLGEDYIGTFDNTVFYLGDLPSQLQGYYMTIDR